jgi:hypothetical protein
MKVSKKNTNVKKLSATNVSKKTGVELNLVLGTTTSLKKRILKKMKSG